MPNSSIAKTYDDLADQYTKESYENHLAVGSLDVFLGLLPANANVLDVGCGGGQDSKYLARHGCRVLGIDISKEMIKKARELAPEARHLNTDLFEFKTDEKFDGIWCCRVFHHISLKEQGDFLEKVASLMKSGGILYITCAVSDKDSDYEAFDSGNGNLLKKRLTSKSFKSILKDHGFQVEKFNFWNGKKGMEIFSAYLK